jgi:hypothetical protein
MNKIVNPFIMCGWPGYQFFDSGPELTGSIPRSACLSNGAAGNRRAAQIFLFSGMLTFSNYYSTKGQRGGLVYGNACQNAASLRDNYFRSSIMTMFELLTTYAVIAFKVPPFRVRKWSHEQ